MAALEPIHDGAKSFYHKAHVTDEGGGLQCLYSYSAKVCCIDKASKAYRLCAGPMSPTTLRHVKEFLAQAGWPAMGTAELIRNAEGREIWRQGAS
jgi:hypothetical protein